MIRAGIIPYVGGYSAVVVAEDGSPLRLVYHNSRVAGALVAREKPVRRNGRTLDMRRDVDADAVAGDLLATIREHGAEHVSIGRPPGYGKAGPARAIRDALIATCAEAGIPTQLARIETAYGLGLRFDGWPTSWPRDERGRDLGRKAIESAAALLLRSTDRGVQREPAPSVVTAGPDRGARKESAGDGARPASDGGNDATPSPEPAPAAPPPLPPPPAPGTVVGSVDPGGEHVGVAVTRVPEAGPLPLLALRTLELGAEPSDDAIETLATEVVDELRAHDVTVVYIETVRAVWLPPNPHAAMAIARALIQQESVYRAIVIFARLADIEARHVTMMQWRRGLVTRQRGVPSDDLIEPAAAACYDAFPVISSVHARDAAGLLGFACRPPPPPKPPRMRNGLVMLAPSASASAARERAKLNGCTCGRARSHADGCPLQGGARQQLIARRAEVGCVCNVGGRHRRECPLFVRKVAE